MTAQTLAYGGLEFTDARIKAGITDGLLDATLETTDVAKGKANGTLSIDSRTTPPAAQLALKLANVEAEPVVNEITGKPLFSGTSNVDITAKAQGQTASQLTSTLEGKAQFQMAKGAIRGFDVRRMISEWWRSWTFDLAMKTGFERLDAQYDIKNGIMKSSPELELQGSEVTITSSGRVNVPARKLNQNIRIKVVPPPTALPIPVRISGDWAKPTIGIDWGGLFSSAIGSRRTCKPSLLQANPCPRMCRPPSIACWPRTCRPRNSQTEQKPCCGRSWQQGNNLRPSGAESGGKSTEVFGKCRLVPAGRVAPHAGIGQYCNFSKRTAVAWCQGDFEYGSWRNPLRRARRGRCHGRGQRLTCAPPTRGDRDLKLPQFARNQISPVAISRRTPWCRALRAMERCRVSRRLARAAKS